MSDYSDSTYETTTYETSYDTTGYDTSAYDTSAYDTTGYVETGSYSYDSTSWSDVSAVSQDYYDSYYAETGIADAYWDLSTQAYLEGDSYAAYNLNQLSIDWSSSADASWDTGNSVWDSMAETTTVTSWEPALDTSGYATSTYDTSWSAAAPVVDTSSYDTTWSAAATDTSTEA